MARQAARRAEAARAARATARADARAARILTMRRDAATLAKSLVGRSYVGGATGPYAFDCSGLTSYIYRKAFRMTIPRVSYDQWKVGTRVSVEDARPGDLVFYFGYGTHHVGIYVGNGKMVHAANPEKGVVLTGILDSDWYTSRFSGIRRIVR